MERYQLVREYPGSPELGTVVFHPHRDRSNQDYHFKMRNTPGVYNCIFYSKDYIKSFPKFWKKI